MPLIIERAVLEFGTDQVFITFSENLATLTGPRTLESNATVNLPANTATIRAGLIAAVANQTGVAAAQITTRGV